MTVAGSARPVVLRNRVNYVSGWVLSLGLLGYIVALDPLSVYTSGRWEYEDPTSRAVEWNYSGFFAVVSILGFRAFARPCVRLANGQLTIVGWLRSLTAPLAAVSDVDTSGEYVRVRLGGRVRTVTGLETRQLGWQEGSDPFTVRLREATHEHPDSAVADAVATRVTWPSVAEAILVLAWVSYAVLALIVGFPR